MSRRDALFLAVLLPVALACYAPGLGAPPVYDDGVAVLHNPRLGSPRLLLRGFLGPTPAVPPGVPAAWYPYRPLAEASLALDSSRWGSLVLHAVSTVLVLSVVRRLAPGLERPAAALFALHPFGVQAVTYLSQRAAALETCLAFASVLLYVKGRTGWAWCAGLLAAMSKETGATVPVVLAAVEGFGERRWRRWLPFALLPILPAAMAIGSLLGKGGDPAAPAPLAYLALEMPVLVRYAFLTALPFPMRFYFDSAPPSAGCAAGAGMLVAAGLAWMLRGPRRHALPRLGLALFLAPLALETVFPIQGVAWCYRCYPSLLGGGILFAWVLGRLAWVPLALMGALAFGENRVWASVPALQARDVRNAFRIPSVWATQGFRRMETGEAARAERLFRRGLRAPGLDLKTAEGHATALWVLGRDEEARREAAALRRAFPRHLSPLWLEIRLAEGEEARTRLEAEASTFPLLRPEMALWLSERRMSRGDWAGAEALLRRHLEQDPAHGALWDHLGWTLLSTGRRTEAAGAYRRAVDLDPSLAKAWYHLGILTRDPGALRRALALRPGYAKARQALSGLEGEAP